MDITFLLKGAFEGLPPMLPRLLCLAEKGHSLHLICSSMTADNRQRLTSAGISCEETRHNTKLFGRENRLMDWKNFRASVVKLLQSQQEDSLLYICSADTAICLGSVLKGKRYVLQSNELYDQLPMYRNSLKKYMRNADAVVVPEYSRANICTFWYGLNKLPYVIPNVPYIQSMERKQPVADPKAAEILHALPGKKLLIYQGHITSGDRSLNVIADALRQLHSSEYALVLMGRDHDGSAEKLKQIYADTYYIPHVAAPGHLQITSHAYIGLLSYDRVSLNNIFCAPNKIYEYSAYGIPMLGNQIPGLKYTVEQQNMGLCADYEDVQSVVAAIRRLDASHESFSRNAHQFFRQTDLSTMLDELLSAL